MKLLKKSVFQQLLTFTLNNKINRMTARFLSVTHSGTQNDEYDVVVSGGGMVGSAMAAALGSEQSFLSKKILLLEGAPEKKYTMTPEFSSRVVAISHASVELLKSVGAWEWIQKMRYHDVKRMQVWDSCSDSLITFNHENLEDNLAYIVENDVISDAISKQLHLLTDNVEVRYNSRIKGYTLPSKLTTDTDEDSRQHLARIHLEDDRTIYTKLLIGADGFRSLLRKTANIHTVEWSYGQHAVVAVLKLSEETENNVAWQRFLKTGPIAMLPLSADASCLIWSTTTADARNLAQLSTDAFVDAVNHAFWSDDDKNPLVNYATQLFDGVLTSVGLQGSSQQQLPPTVIDIQESSRAMFPLGLCHASQYVKSRMALIGDAAHRIHPLAGQGVNLGFGDVACLRDQLVTALQNGADIGSVSHLLEYESTRQRHVVPIMATLDGLNRLYGTTWTPVVMARSLGLQATNALGPIKERLIKGATS